MGRIKSRKIYRLFFINLTTAFFSGLFRSFFSSFLYVLFFLTCQAFILAHREFVGVFAPSLEMNSVVIARVSRGEQVWAV